MQQNEKRIIIFIVLTILGLVISLQVRSIMKLNEQKASSSFNNIVKLKEQLDSQKEVGNHLKQLINEKEKVRDDYLKNAIKNNHNEQLKTLKEELDDVKIKAGLTDVKGAGIVIKMDDALARITNDQNVLIIHDSDILKVINELKKAGAQAIAINNERLVSISEQVCAGPTIRVNKRKYATPFEIKAVGDSKVLYDSINNSEIVYLLLKDKIRVTIEKFDQLEVPKYIDNKIQNPFSGLEVVEQ